MKRESPRTRLLKMKYLKGFNPKKPTVELIKRFKEEQLPKSSYLNTNTRGKYINELTLDQAEYISYALKNGSDKLKLLCKLYYFCRLYKNLEEEGMTEEEFDMFVEEEFNDNNEQNSDIDF